MIGDGIKSINQFYNKEKAEIQGIYDRQKIKDGDKLRRLRVKRDKKAKDCIHKLSRFIVNWCEKHKIGTIIFGYNPDWKQNIGIGKRNNQTFTQVPYMDIIQKNHIQSRRVWNRSEGAGRISYFNMFVSG